MNISNFSLIGYIEVIDIKACFIQIYGITIVWEGYIDNL